MVCLSPILKTVTLSFHCSAIKQLQQNPSVTGRTVSDAESDVQKLQTKLSVLKKALTKTAAEENKLATEVVYCFTFQSKFAYPRSVDIVA